MSDEQAFLQEVLAHPDDMGPRRVFADWLEEQGDPRGEFIRVQCELGELGPYDPRRGELERRERALLDEHREQWLEPIRRVVDNPRYRRGFVESFSITPRRFVEHATQLFEVWPVRRVQFFPLDGHTRDLALCPHLRKLGGLNLYGGLDVPRVRFDTLFASPNLTGLKTLELSEGRTGDILLQAAARARGLSSVETLQIGRAGLPGITALATASSLPKLKNLTLRHAQFTLPALTGLLETPHLAGVQSLDLQYSPLAPVLVRVLGAAALTRQLEALDLSHCGLGFAGIETWRTTAHFHQLKRLSLTADGIGDAGLQGLFRGSDWCARNLTQLHLSGNTLHDVSAKRLAACRSFATLQELDLSQNQLTAEGAMRLVQDPAWSKLQSLNLADNPLGTEGVGLLTGESGCPDLLWLNLANCGLAMGAIRLTARQEPLRLQQLNLSGNALEDIGIQGLSLADCLREVVTLDLSNNRISDDGARGLAEAAWLEGVASLNLGRNRIGPAGIRALAQSPHLARVQALILDDNPIGARGAKSLAESPNCRGLLFLSVNGCEIPDRNRAPLIERFGSRVVF